MDIRYSAMDEPSGFSSEVRNCKYYPQVFRHVQGNGHNTLKLGSLYSLLQLALIILTENKTILPSGKFSSWRGLFSSRLYNDLTQTK